jgi:hypothetical protein
MKRRTRVVLALILGFSFLVGAALWREFARDAEQIQHSISGRLDVDGALLSAGGADLARTDRVALILVDPKTRKTVALKFESPLVPPMNFQIGLQDVRDGQSLTGHYDLIAITDKDGEVFHAVPGEAYGRAGQPVALGDRQVEVLLSQPFRGTLSNEASGSPSSAPPVLASDDNGPPGRSVSGTVRASKELAGKVSPGDRLVVMLFDPESGQPAAVSVVALNALPQRFKISIPTGQPLRNGYSLRILTDKDGSPFGAAPGEIVGRSSGLVPPGTADLDFVMDQLYAR